MSELTFNSEKHEYLLSGQRLLSVTQVLKISGLIDDSYFTEYSANKGSMVHLACQMQDENDLQEDTLDPIIVPYLEAWIKFKVETGWINSEPPELQVYSELGFAGMIDRIGFFQGDGRPSVLDIKTGAPQPYHALQLAGYDLAYREHKDPMIPLRRFAVHLTADGKYKVKEYTDRNDLKVFQAVVILANWKGK